MTLIDGTPSPVAITPASEPHKGGDPAAVPRGSGRKLWLAILILYLFAFALPVFDDTGILANHLGVRPNGSVYGWQAFLVGLVMQRTGWFANIAIWIGIFLLARGRPLLAATAGLVALGLGSMYLSILADHSLVSPQSFSVGYFCWLGSAVLLTGAGLGLRLFGPGRGSLLFATATGATGVAVLVTVAHYIIVTTAPPTEATLADRLTSGDVAARRAAARKLALDHNPKLIPVFIRAANDSDDKVRQSAIGALGDIGPAAASAVPTLIAVLSTPLAEPPTGKIDWKRAASSRSAAAAARGNLGPVAKEAVPALSAALKDENVPVRRWSATSLGEMGHEGRPAIPALLAALGDSDLQVRRYAIQSLMKIGPSADCVPQLSSCLHDEDATVRETAAALVKSLKKPQ